MITLALFTATVLVTARTPLLILIGPVRPELRPPSVSFPNPVLVSPALVVIWELMVRALEMWTISSPVPPGVVTIHPVMVEGPPSPLRIPPDWSVRVVSPGPARVRVLGALPKRRELVVDVRRVAEPLTSVLIPESKLVE